VSARGHEASFACGVVALAGAAVIDRAATPGWRWPVDMEE